jgi:exopolysaccharide biosynthesis WecB/TagA/CpsF family protein
MSIVLELDRQDLDQFTQIAAGYGFGTFGYVVTPNVDHVIRYHDDPAFRQLYSEAAYTLLDSHFLAHLLRLTRGLRAPVCPGSTLTARLFENVIRTEDRISLIGGSAQQAAQLAARFGLKNLQHMNPPMGFIRDPVEVEKVLQFLERCSPCRFHLLAVGCPQQEMLAQRMLHRGSIKGMALCIGSSVNFLTDNERRAPAWIQGAGLEWLFRLLQSPGRLGKRYLIRGPRVFAILKNIEVHFKDQA